MSARGDPGSVIGEQPVREADEPPWVELNQMHLAAALEEVRDALRRHAARPASAPAGDLPARPVAPDVLGTIADRGIDAGGRRWPDGIPPPALDRLAATFGLSPFERSVLVLAAAHELDGAVAGMCAAAHGDPAQRYPTLGLALAALHGAHWSALSPSSPLRYWRLIELDPVAGEPVIAAPLRIDERILHYLTGVPCGDQRLAGLVWAATVGVPTLPPSQAALAAHVAAALAAPSNGVAPVIQLVGPSEEPQLEVAAAVCDRLGLGLTVLDGAALPADASAVEAVTLLLTRESALSTCALFVRAGSRQVAPSPVATLRQLLQRFGGPAMVGTATRLLLAGRAGIAVDISTPTRAEQRQLWREAVAPALVPEDRLDRLISQFDLSAPAIRAIGSGAAARGTVRGQPGDPAQHLWDAARDYMQPRMQHLAQVIVPAATWDDLVLPDRQQQLLGEIAAQAVLRSRVYDTWGFGQRTHRGLGVSALFAGPSGTGKTMAAEVLAGDLGLDLYRIDLSAVVSKYIGETEKNLRLVFDEAEGGGAVLFFDEADALFGKRSEVKDSHDRYANVEVSYLLQRMECYSGVAILATNMRGAIDPAFLRRIRFVVTFPFPGPAERAAIWARSIPADAPTEGIDISQLARLNVTGGSIRNIAVNAAFLAAASRERLGMGHLQQAARAELTKLERPTGTELEEW
jgi:hypothetical protein